MSRGYTTLRERGWKEATHSPMASSEYVHHPFILETEGKQIPIIRHASGSNGESNYVIKAEIIEHSIGYAPEYRYRWQPAREEFKDFEVERHRYHNPDQRFEFRDFGVDNQHDHRYPEQKFVEFIKKVQDEVHRGGATKPVTLPLTTWRSGTYRPIAQENNRKYDDERDFRKNDRKKLNDSPNRDRDSAEPYPNNTCVNTQPAVGCNGDVCEFYRRPQGYEGPYAKSHPLSKPTNDIRTATEFLKESIKPVYGNIGKVKEKETNHMEFPKEPIKPSYYGNGMEKEKEYRNGKEKEKEYGHGKEKEKEYGNGKEKEKEKEEYGHGKEKEKEYGHGKEKEKEYGNGKQKEKELNARAYNEHGRQPKTNFPLGLGNGNGKEKEKEFNTSAYNEHSRQPKTNIPLGLGNGKEKEKEFNTSAYNEPSRQPKTNFPLGLGNTRWRTGTSLSGPHMKVEQNDSESEDEEEEEEEEEEESRNPLGKFNGLKITKNRGGEKPVEKKDGYENPKHINALPLQFEQRAGKKKTPETIDSREASRRYGKMRSRTMEEEEEYAGTINSRDAVRKYNGALVP